jgi:hypothetical protein
MPAPTSHLFLTTGGPDDHRSLLHHPRHPGNQRRKAEKLLKSFCLGTVNIERLWRYSEHLGQEAGRQIIETEAIKGVLLLGEKTDDKKLLALVKDAVFESK